MGSKLVTLIMITGVTSLLQPIVTLIESFNHLTDDCNCIFPLFLV